MFNIETNNKGNISPIGVRGDTIAPSIILSPSAYFNGSWRPKKAKVTLTLTSNPSNNETFTLGGKIYTYKTALTAAQNEIAIGTTLAETKLNTVGAINGDASLSGSGYSQQTRPHQQVSIANFIGDVAVITASEAGTSGNSIVSTETLANGSFSSVTLLGGQSISDADLAMVPSISGSASTFLQSHYGNTFSAEYRNYASRDILDYLVAASGERKVHIPSYGGGNYKRLKMNISAFIKKNITTSYNSTISELGTNTFAILTSANSMRVGTIAADGTITYGATFTHGVNINNMVGVGADKIIGVRLVSASSVEVQHFSVTAGVIAHVSSTTFAITSGSLLNTEPIKKTDTGKAILFYNSNSNVEARIVDVTGSITVGAATIVNTGTTRIISTVLSPSLVAIAWGSSAGTNGDVKALSISGSAITAGTGLTANIKIFTSTGLPNIKRLSNTSFLVFADGDKTTYVTPVIEQFNVAGTVVTSAKVINMSFQNNSGAIGLCTVVGEYHVTKIAEGEIAMWFRGTNLKASAPYFFSSGKTYTMTLKLAIDGLAYITAIKENDFAFFDIDMAETMGYKEVGQYDLLIQGSAPYGVWVSKLSNVEIYDDEDNLLATKQIQPTLVPTSIDLSLEIPQKELYLKVVNKETYPLNISITGALAEIE